MCDYSKVTSFAVIHSLPTWLPLTATWLYNQVLYLPKDINNHVVCERTENLGQFKIQNIHCLNGEGESPIIERLAQRLRLQGLSRRRFLNLLLEVARKHRALVLHSHWGDTGWKDIHAARKAGLCHVVTFYGKDVNYYPQFPEWRERYRSLFRCVDLVLCEGPHMAQCIVRLGCPDNKILVHHLGVNVEKIRFNPRVWNGGPLRILIAASFREKKGIPHALRAIGLLRGELPGLELTIIGDASRDPRSQPEKARILKTLRDSGLESKTRMMGYQPHAVLFQEAYEHHIFISPSLTASDGDTEGGAPISLIEMAATGMPALSTTHCDIPSVIIHGETGLLAAERDVGGLVEHLRWYVTHPELWHNIVMAGRQHIEMEYNATKQASRLRDIYLSALSSKERT